MVHGAADILMRKNQTREVGEIGGEDQFPPGDGLFFFQHSVKGAAYGVSVDAR